MKQAKLFTIGFTKKSAETFFTRLRTAGVKLLEERQANRLVTGKELKEACLLCSELTPGKCHRRLVAEFFTRNFDDLEIYHL